MENDEIYLDENGKTAGYVARRLYPNKMEKFELPENTSSVFMKIHQGLVDKRLFEKGNPSRPKITWPTNIDFADLYPKKLNVPILVETDSEGRHWTELNGQRVEIEKHSEDYYEKKP